MDDAERGESLIGVVVAVALVATAMTALLASLLAAAHRFGPDPVAAALQRSARRELRIAADLAKYRGASLVPTSVATTLPLPSAAPIAAHLRLDAIADADGSLDVTITATSDANPNERAVVTRLLAPPVPLPSSDVPAARDGAAPQ